MNPDILDRRQAGNNALTMSSSIAEGTEEGIKGNRRGPGGPCAFIRNLSFLTLLALVIGASVIVLDAYDYISVQAAKDAKAKLYRTIEQIEQQRKVISAGTTEGMISAGTTEGSTSIPELQPAAAVSTNDVVEIANAESKPEDLFCSECTWYGRISCGARKDYMIDHHGVDPKRALEDMVNNEPNCKRSLRRR